MNRCLLAAVFCLPFAAPLLAASPAEEMQSAAQAFIDTLSEEQAAATLLPYDSPKRVQWHFIPLSERKGFQIKHMNAEQRKAAYHLLRSALSKTGYQKATGVMALEGVLAELEKSRRGGPIRDAERYYVTLFGEPGDDRWGLSIEGHHLSLNWVVGGQDVVSSTPTFFGTNPATIHSNVSFTVAGTTVKKGTQVLKLEEKLAFDLINALDQPRRNQARIAEKAPAEIRAAGEPQPPTTKPEGIAYGELPEAQQKALGKLIAVYANALPKKVAQQRLARIQEAGVENVHFAWAGATEPGVGHYYRIQGPTFLIELVNVQPDAEGNPANHVHAVWRDLGGDFALSLK